MTSSTKPEVHNVLQRRWRKTNPCILTIISLLQQEIYDAQKLSYFSHLNFTMLLHYLAKQTLILVSVLHVCFNEVNGPQSDLKSN